MSTSALDAVLLALVTLFDTATDATTKVYDGPSVAAASDMEAVIVGADDAVSPHDMRSGQEQQEWAQLGAGAKNATGFVVCTVLTQSGSTNVTERRARAFAILAQCEDALRGDIDLTGGSLLYAGLSAVDVRQQQTADGAVVRLVCTITYRARI